MLSCVPFQDVACLCDPIPGAIGPRCTTHLLRCQVPTVWLVLSRRKRQWLELPLRPGSISSMR
jgi:hypothetical protein